MRSSQTLALVALVALVAPSAAEEMAQYRIFTLQDMDYGEAMPLLRADAKLAKMAAVPELGVLVVRDTADRLEHAESLLREREALAEVVDPHEGVPSMKKPVPFRQRLYRIRGADRQSIAIVLRAIYGARHLELRDEDGISVRDWAPELDRIEAMLATLGVLAGVKDER